MDDHLSHTENQMNPTVHMVKDDDIMPLDSTDDSEIPDSNWLRWSIRLLAILLPLSFLVALVLVFLFAVPVMLTRWRLAEAEVDAEAAYMKRRAELRAEAEAAQEQLDLLDKRTNLVSLGFRSVVRKVSPSVVNVSSYRLLPPDHADALGKKLVLYDPKTKNYFYPNGVGSGVLVSEGRVLTNHHVVKNADKFRITFASGQTISVEKERIRSDAISDLALILLPEDAPEVVAADYRFPATFADSDLVERGDLVVALGSPLGLRQTVTHGVISAKGRLLSMLDMVELLQTDAAINPGNSGGPLFDQLGRVVGINVAIASETGGNQGIGFAIPSNTVQAILNDLNTKGRVDRGFIGVGMDELTSSEAEDLGLDRSGGVRITRVVPDFPAAEAGLQEGDVIVKLNGKDLPIADTMRFFRQRILDSDIGEVVSLEVIRGSERQGLQMRIGQRPTDIP